MKHPLVALEERGAQALTSGDGAAFYRTCLTDDALMVVPGFVVDKAMFLGALTSEAPWLSFLIEEPRVAELTKDCAVVQYRGRGSRQGQPEYVALISSFYVKRDDSWKLAYHQQTPTPVDAIESRSVRGSVADQKAIQDIASRWQDAWNRHDMDALSSLVAEDVDFVNVGGRWMRNRQEFKDHHAERHEIVFKESVWTTKGVHLKFIRSDVVVIHMEWSIKGDRNTDGTPREPREGLFTWVVEKQNGQWLIVAAQNTNVAARSRK